MEKNTWNQGKDVTKKRKKIRTTQTGKKGRGQTLRIIRGD